jgi:DNA-binding NarL/FixJ family response regulator
MFNSPAQPIQVVIMDDDYFALEGKALLLARDLRTVVCARCLTPEQLLTWLAVQRNQPNGAIPDVILLDVEYQANQLTTRPLPVLLERCRVLAPEAAVLCISQYGAAEIVRAAVEGGTRGFLLKADVRLALATAVVRAHEATFVYTPSVETLLGELFPKLLATAARLEPWELHPDLTPRLEQIFWLCLVYGMPARLAAEEAGLQQASIERYRTQMFDILGDGWHDETHLAAVQEKLARTLAGAEKAPIFKGLDWAYHIGTQPPAFEMKR